MRAPATTEIALPHTDDPDHSNGVIGDVLLLKRELKQRRDNLQMHAGLEVLGASAEGTALVDAKPGRVSPVVSQTAERRGLTA